MKTTADIIALLQNVKKTGTNSWQASCPCTNAHKNGDQTPSLTVTAAGERTLLCCHTGCTFTEICEALNVGPHELSGRTFDDFIRWHSMKNNLTYICGYSYDYGPYHDGLKKLRFIDAQGKKTFRWIHDDPEAKYGFTMNHDGCPHRLFVAGNLNDDKIILVEGEKDAFTVHDKFGLTAVSAENGASKNNSHKKWYDEYNKQLADKTVYILNDNDEIGAAFQAIAAANLSKACTVYIVDITAIWPEAPAKGDITDFVESAGAEVAKAALLAGIENATEYAPAPNSPADQEQQLPAKAPAAVTVPPMGETGVTAIDNFLKDYTAFDMQSYAITAQGVTTVKTNNAGQPLFDASTGEAIIKTISPIPVLPTAMSKNMDTDIEYVEISFFKRNRWNKITINRGTIADRNKILLLADKGIEVTSETARDLSIYLNAIIVANAKIIPYKDSKTALGWADDDCTEFLPYSNNVVFDGQTDSKIYKAIKSKGSLDAWADAIGPWRKHIEIRLALATAFAAPITCMTFDLPFITHIWGQSGYGKTVVEKIAASIWGDPKRYISTVNSTKNALLTTATMLNNLPMIIDELQIAKMAFDNFDNLVMQLSEGEDRARDNKAGELRQTKQWRNTFIISGEEPLVKENSNGGAINRVVEIELKNKLFPDVGPRRTLIDTINKNYGLAGPAFIELCKVNKDNIGETFVKYNEAISERTGATDKQADAMATLLTADALATSIFWPDEELVEIEDIADLVKTDKDVNTAERSYQYILDVIISNMPKFLTGEKADRVAWGVADYPTYSRFGEEAQDMDKDLPGVYFMKTFLVDSLNAKGFDYKAVMSGWMAKGYLKTFTNKGAKVDYTQKKIRGINKNCVYITLPAGVNIDDIPDSTETPFDD